MTLRRIMLRVGFAAVTAIAVSTGCGDSDGPIDVDGDAGRTSDSGIRPDGANGSDARVDAPGNVSDARPRIDSSSGDDDDDASSDAGATDAETEDATTDAADDGSVDASTIDAADADAADADAATPDTGTPDTGAPASVPCPTFAPSAPKFTNVQLAESTPAFTGGTISDGFYHLVELRQYNGAGGATGTSTGGFGWTMRFEGIAWQGVVSFDGTAVASSFGARYRTEGNVFAAARTCGGLSLTSSFYTVVSADEVHIRDDDKPNQVLVLRRAP